MSRGAVFAAIVAAVAAAGCGDLVGFGGPPTPLATIHVELSGDVEPLRPPGTANETVRLHAALIWGDQWQPEPLCFLPPESDEAAAVIAAGCPDNFAFMPKRVAAVAPVDTEGTATIELFELPSAEVMVGDVTARIAYASVVVFDDRDGDGDVRLRHDDGEGEGPAEDAILDFVYGASFLSMSQPDTRIAFREGDFEESAFFPRAGCEPPPPGFSILSAGGFSEADAIAAVLSGELPQQDPASCRNQTLDSGVVTVPLFEEQVAREAICEGVGGRGYPDYHEAEQDFPDLTERTYACVHVPSFGGYEGGDEIQLVMAGPPRDVCRGVTHFVLRGCSDDPNCEIPEFDFSDNPPDGWPCEVR